MGKGFSWPSLPRVGGADSARLLCTTVIVIVIVTVADLVMFFRE
jgi:hypothetical protein